MARNAKGSLQLPRCAGPVKALVFGFVAMVVVACGGGGGGGDDWLFPLWVETDVVVADVDLDGRNDLLTLAQLAESMSRREGRLNVFSQTEQGAFPAPDTTIVGEYPWQLVAADINGDALPDILAADPVARNVFLLPQDPDNPGRFLTQQMIAENLLVYSTAVGDFNNDGLADIAAGDDQAGSSRIVLFYQDPTSPATFLAGSDLPIPGSSSDNLASADIDGDGLDDLIAWIYLSGGVTPQGVLVVYLQQADGILGTPITLAPQTGLNVRHLAIADYDADGRKDIFVFFSPANTDARAKLCVLLQESVPGTFAAPVDTLLTGIRGIDDAVAADLDNDGRPDFAVAGFYPEGSPSTVGSRLSLFMQSGAGAFAFAGDYDMPITVSRLTAGDMNGDGLNDIVVYGGQDQCRLMTQMQDMHGNFHTPRPL